MPCYDGRSDEDYKYDNGRHDGKKEGYDKGYQDAKEKYETPSVIKIEGEHSEMVDNLNNQIIELYSKCKRLRNSVEVLKNEKERNNKLEASLCALITELEKRDIANDVISQASRSGLIDLMGFWKEHKQEDETKLALKLHNMFSEHEQEVIKKLLNEKKSQ